MIPVINNIPSELSMGKRSGSLAEDAFNRWLVQDYLFMRGFAGFASLAVGKTPRPGQSVLIGGLSALDDELEEVSVGIGSGEYR